MSFLRKQESTIHNSFTNLFLISFRLIKEILWIAAFVGMTNNLKIQIINFVTRTQKQFHNFRVAIAEK